MTMLYTLEIMLLAVFQYHIVIELNTLNNYADFYAYCVFFFLFNILQGVTFDKSIYKGTILTAYYIFVSYYQ